MPLTPSAKRRRRRKKVKLFLDFCLILGIVLISPVLIPIFIYEYQKSEKIKRKISEIVRCAYCKNIMGIAYVDLSDKEQLEHMKKLQDENPGMRFRMYRKHDAICTYCRTHYLYQEKTRFFEEVKSFPREDEAPTADALK